MEPIKRFKSDGLVITVTPQGVKCNKEPLNHEHLICKNSKGWIYLVPLGVDPLPNILLLAFSVEGECGLYAYPKNKKGRINKEWESVYVYLLETLEPQLSLHLEVKKGSNERCVGRLRTWSGGTPIRLEGLDWLSKSLLINKVVISVDSEEVWVHKWLVSEYVSEFIHECKDHIQHSDRNTVICEEVPDEVELVFDADLCGE
jgi:hypothetical protein